MTHPLRHYIVALGLSVLVNLGLLQLMVWVNDVTQPAAAPKQSHHSQFIIDRSAPPQHSIPHTGLSPAVQAAGVSIPKLVIPSAIRFTAPQLDTLALAPDLLTEGSDLNGDSLIFREDAVDRPSRLVSRKMPRYPRLARQQRIEGFVAFKIVVGPDGTVESTQLLDSQPAGIFEASAEKVINHFRYSPAKVDGRAVRSYKRQKIHFTLRK